MKLFRLSKNARNAFFVFVIAFSAFLAFEPLFKYLGQTAAQEFASAIFGTIFAAVITMVLLNKQSQTEAEKNKSDKVFEQKLFLYNNVIDSLENIFEQSKSESPNISSNDILHIEFQLLRMMMVSDDKTLLEFNDFYKSLTRKYSRKSRSARLDSSDKQKIFRFADYCRQELGLSSKNMEKEILEDIVLQSELLHGLQHENPLLPETIETLKDIYGYLAFDLNIREIVFINHGFEAYANSIHYDHHRFLTCTIEDQNIHLILNGHHNIKELSPSFDNNRTVFVFSPDSRNKLSESFGKVEKAILLSLQTVKQHKQGKQTE